MLEHTHRSHSSDDEVSAQDPREVMKPRAIPDKGDEERIQSPAQCTKGEHESKQAVVPVEQGSIGEKPAPDCGVPKKDSCAEPERESQVSLPNESR